MTLDHLDQNPWQFSYAIVLYRDKSVCIMETF